MTSLWGFSALIKTPEHTILFDTGSNGRILLKNLQAQNHNLSKVDTIFISHAHWDHIGGVDSILELNPNVHIFVTSHVSKNMIRDLKTLSKGVTIIGDEPTKLFSDIYSTGAMGDASEQSIIIDTNDGLIVISGCAHSGIQAIAKRAKDTFDKEILLLLGGFHLFSKDEVEVTEVVNHIKALGTKYVCPSHCTGEKAKNIFRQKFGKYYIDGGAGINIAFDQKGEIV